MGDKMKKKTDPDLVGFVISLCILGGLNFGVWQSSFSAGMFASITLLILTTVGNSKRE